jgi:hypothetical protein
MATDPPESTKSVRMKVMWTSPEIRIPPQGKTALLHAWADQAADRGQFSSVTLQALTSTLSNKAMCSA